MVQQANIKMPLICWQEIAGTNEEYNVLDDGTIEHVIMHQVGFFGYCN